jgi:hypothetical protein
MLVGLAVCSALGTACGGDDAGATKAPAREPARPQVRVDPKTGPPGTVFVFKGRGWRPHVRVEALYDDYCPEEEGRICSGVGHGARIVPDERGRFTFRFREGPGDARELRPPAAAGGGPVTFQQFVGRDYHGDAVRRTPKYRVEPAGGSHRDAPPG